MKPFFSLFWIYSLVNLLAIPFYYLAIIVAAFSTDSGGIGLLTFTVLYVPVLFIHVILLLVTLAIKRIRLSRSRKLIFGGIYSLTVLVLYTVILFVYFL
ncbi:hypothetical protein [Sporolactobacillus laevolacticus]|uniref:Uncharacterized protein n=1 Tax=Sporolactobacillus laevolacticus DSM 442 TaxID=1395513 RepID=V6IUU6_9BACL|nr:hypothetical protein [Sporolactobacillus laevolacticus]EST10948.1 hypothetical protein P343_15170 [Sporolactobacillus laevolacticus DSM 442]